LRKAGLAGTTVSIKLRWSNFTTITRQKSLPSPTNADQEIYDTAVMLFKKNHPAGTPVRLIGVGVSNLCEPVLQLCLWDTPRLKEHDLLTAIDTLRAKYGREIIQRAGRIERGHYEDQADEA